jgi:hypothetical protein
MLATSKSSRFSIKLLQVATQAATLALLVLGALESRPIAAQTLQAAARSGDAGLATTGSTADASISSIRTEDALIQRLAGRVVKQASSIGRTTTQSLPPAQKSASALALNPVETAAAPAPAVAAPTPLPAALPHTPSEVALAAIEPMRPADTVKIQPASAPVKSVAPQTPLPPTRQVALQTPLPTVTADRVFQAPQMANPPIAPGMPTNPAYLGAMPYGMGGHAAPGSGYPMPMAIAANPYNPAPAYGYGYPMNAPTYPMVPQAMPPLPSPYAALQNNAYGGGMGLQLTPPVSRLQAGAAPQLMAQQYAPAVVAPSVLPSNGYPTAYAQPQYAPQQYAPPQYAAQQPAPQYMMPPQPYLQPQPQQYVPPQYYAMPQYAPQYYAQQLQQYVPPQYQMPYGQPQQQQYAPPPYGQPQYYQQPQPQYYQQPQPQYYQQPQPQYVPLAQPTPQLGAYPQGGYQQPAVANPLNAPLSVPVSPTGVATPSTEATALKGTQSPLIRSTASNQPSLTLQGVYLYQGDENSARGRITGVYPLSSKALFGTTLDVSTGKGFSDTPNSGFNVNELFFATSLAEIPNLRFAVGQLDLTSYFDRNSFAKDGATHFFNSTFQTNPALAAAGLGSRPGLLVNWSLSDNLEAKAVAFSSSRGLSDFALNAFAGEVGLRYGNAILRGTYVTGRESGGGNVFDGAGSINRGGGLFGIQPDDRESAFGVNGEVFIPKMKMGLFARYGRYNNLDANEGADTYGAGLSFLDVFSTDDRLGLAYGSALTNERLRRSVGLPKRDVLELFYDFRFLPNLRFGLSLQQRNDFSEIVAGVRVKTEFDITPKGRQLQ